MGFVFLLIVLIIIGTNLEYLMNKMLRVSRKKISETPGKRINRWVRVIIVIIYVCGLPYVITSNKIQIVIGFMIFLMVSLFGFQAFLEWKYLKNSKQYLSTIFLLIIFVVILYGIGIFFS